MLTEQEQEYVSELRKRITDLEYTEDDEDLIRWIRARNYDLDLAEELLRNSLKWRSENDISSLVTMEFDPIYLSKYPRKFECHDNEGRPVISVPFGRWDVPFTVATEENTETFRKFMYKGCEELMGHIKAADKISKERITQCVLIVDIAGFSFMNLLNVYAIQNGLALLSAYEQNYPETLHSCYLINTTSSVSMLLSLVKPVLSQKTFDKIKVFSATEDFTGSLGEVIDLNELSIEVGGRKGDEVEECEECEEFFECE